MHNDELRRLLEEINPRLLMHLKAGADVHTVKAETDGQSGGLLVTIGYAIEDNGYGWVLEELRAIVKHGSVMRAEVREAA